MPFDQLQNQILVLASESGLGPKKPDQVGTQNVFPTLESSVNLSN